MPFSAARAAPRPSFRRSSGASGLSTRALVAIGLAVCSAGCSSSQTFRGTVSPDAVGTGATQPAVSMRLTRCPGKPWGKSLTILQLGDACTLVRGPAKYDLGTDAPVCRVSFADGTHDLFVTSWDAYELSKTMNFRVYMTQAEATELRVEIEADDGTTGQHAVYRFKGSGTGGTGGGAICVDEGNNSRQR
jgi:hypothetical protein